MNVLFSYSSGALNDREIVKFTDDATDEEIEEYFSEWIEEHYRAHWEPVSDRVDAYENWF